MHFLGGVHHLKVGGEAADDLQSYVWIEVIDEVREFLAFEFVVFAAPYRAQSGGLDEVEELVATLFANQFADERAQDAHVVAQGLVLVFEGYVLAT
jgi:hypothetical protein